MSKPKQTASGKWTLTVRHPDLPGGRRYYTFDSQADAVAYDKQWRLMRAAKLAPPAEMLQPREDKRTLGLVLREWINSGKAAPTQLVTLEIVRGEVAGVAIKDCTYRWLEAYILSLKTGPNLAPSSIRHRVQALGRALDEFLRQHPDIDMVNPTRLLPKGYSSYNDRDRRLVEAGGKTARFNVARDRRLDDAEYERILRALSGEIRPDRERGLGLDGGPAMRVLFQVLYFTGLRLKEAVTLRRGMVDLTSRVIRAQSSKQWRGRVVHREVPIRRELVQVLTDYLRDRTMLPTAPIFPWWDGDEDYRDIGRRLSDRFTTAFDYANVLDFTEHDLRHSATCMWFELRDSRGNWLFRSEEINRLMGWATGSTMADRYASFRGHDFSARLVAAGN